MLIMRHFYSSRNPHWYWSKSILLEIYFMHISRIN